MSQMELHPHERLQIVPEKLAPKQRERFFFLLGFIIYDYDDFSQMCLASQSEHYFM